MRLIDADVLTKETKKKIKENNRYRMAVVDGEFIDLINDAPTECEWISVKDRLPTHEDGKVLICTAYGISIAQKTTTNHWKGDNAIPKLITHWMPLPEAPKEE